MNKVSVVVLSLFLGACSSLDSKSNFADSVADVQPKGGYIQVTGQSYVAESKANVGADILKSSLYFTYYKEVTPNTAPESSITMDGTLSVTRRTEPGRIAKSSPPSGRKKRGSPTIPIFQLLRGPVAPRVLVQRNREISVKHLARRLRRMHPMSSTSLWNGKPGLLRWAPGNFLPLPMRNLPTANGT